MKRLFFILVLLSCIGITIAETVTFPPSHLHLNPFYKKYLDADGIPVVSSLEVSDEALITAKRIILNMLEKRQDIRDTFIKHKFKFAIIAYTESTTDLPEYRHLVKPPKKYFDVYTTDRKFYEMVKDLSHREYWDLRARGLGGTLRHPICSVGEENLFVPQWGRYQHENILVHEFGHGIHAVIRVCDYPLYQEIEKAYRQAVGKGLWKGTYAGNNSEEYFAIGSQCWFNCSRDKSTGSHIHNEINLRKELKTYDPALYNIMNKIYPEKIDPKILPVLTQKNLMPQNLNRKPAHLANASTLYPKLAGIYEFNPHHILEIRHQKGSLTAQIKGQPERRIYPASESLFFTQNLNIEFTFIKNKDGKPGYLIMNLFGKNYRANRKDH